ncbi:DMT family transporter [Orrella sp. JC864]|uniref:DMT family transporter n=1 Tax=Orrella sp. JC864 TaxID=3120298 RepID=UPI0012BC2581
MRPTALLLLLCLAAIWGAAFLFMRQLVPVIGIVPNAFLRVLISAAGLAAIVALLGKRWEFRGKLRAIMLIGMVNSGLPVLLFSIAAWYLPAGYSAIFNAMTPLMGALIGSLFFAERLTRAKLLGLVLGLAGVAVLSGAGPVPLSAQLLYGAAACLAATACYGFAGYFTRRWINERGGLDSALSALGSQAGATLLLLPVFLATSLDMPWTPLLAPRILLALAGLGLLCTAVAYMLYFRLLAEVGPLKSLSVTFLIPPFGVGWGALLLDEPLSWAHLQGGLLIGVALWLVLRTGPAAKA